MTSSLPQFVRDLLASPPRAGEGVHNWLYRVARQLHAHLPAAEIVRLLEERVRSCGRHVPRAEIVAAVQNSIVCAWEPRGTNSTSAIAPAPRKWPEVNQEQRHAALRDGLGLADLWECSPVRIEDNEVHTERVVDALFPGDPLLCVGDPITLPDGETSQAFDTKPREDWRGDLSQHSFITPSPMSSVSGVTLNGKPSKHTLSNTGPRRFLVVEFDDGTADEHAGILLYLARRAPLALAVHSGGKSLHGWFFCAGQPEDRLLGFFRLAASLGADPATWTRSQFVRMPDGTRADGKRQTVFFFNPSVITA